MMLVYNVLLFYYLLAFNPFNDLVFDKQDNQRNKKTEILL